jgi:hypothetical protein
LPTDGKAAPAGGIGSSMSSQHFFPPVSHDCMPRVWWGRAGPCSPSSPLASARESLVRIVALNRAFTLSRSLGDAVSRFEPARNGGSTSVLEHHYTSTSSLLQVAAGLGEVCRAISASRRCDQATRRESACIRDRAERAPKQLVLDGPAASWTCTSPTSSSSSTAPEADRALRHSGATLRLAIDGARPSGWWTRPESNAYFT